MDQAIVIAVFVAIMMIIEINNIKKIRLRAKTNYVRMSLSIIISITACIILWPKEISGQIQLITISLLILFYGFLPEGLGNNELVRAGVLNGDYHRYKKIVVERNNRSKDQTRVDFHLRRNSSYLIFDQDFEKVKRFIFENINYPEKNVEIIPDKKN